MNDHPNDHFNDYIINPQPPQRFIGSPDRSMSSHSIYYGQNSLSRKKLTVISRDNSRPQLKGDYLMGQNCSSLVQSNRSRMENNSCSPMRNVESTHTAFSQRTSQAIESLANSRVSRSKLKRPISPCPSPMTPTKVLRLKKSMTKQNNGSQLSNTLLSNNYAISIPRQPQESIPGSPFKSHQESSHRRTNTASENRMSTVSYHETPDAFMTENIKKQLMGMVNMRILEFRERIRQQEELVGSLQRKLQENSMRLRQKDTIIDEFRNREARSKSTNTMVQGNAQKSMLAANQPYLLKRFKDLEAKFTIFSTQQKSINQTLQAIESRSTVLESHLVSYLNSKICFIRQNLQKFLERKSEQLNQLGQNTSYLDNKLIGRTQAIKETICELKQKVKQVEDSWTHKDTRETRESTNVARQETEQHCKNGQLSQNQQKNTPSIKRFQSRLKQLTTLPQPSVITPFNQGSLQFSLTSYEQSKPLITKKNVYYNEDVEDMSMYCGENNFKQDASGLTDDFFYPGSTSHSSFREGRNDVSSIGRKEGSGENRFSKGKMSTPKNQGLAPSPTTIKPFSNVSSSPSTPPSSEQIVRISNQAITSKIQSIKQLIQNKQFSDQIQKGQLRCYVDKSGYLKYTDSKTFVFDLKGNLISCTEGEFWFLVTKGLIYGKRDDEESRTMSFIQYDE